MYDPVALVMLAKSLDERQQDWSAIAVRGALEEVDELRLDLQWLMDRDSEFVDRDEVRSCRLRENKYPLPTPPTEER